MVDPKLKMELTSDEAGLIMLVRSSKPYCKITVHKLNGKIERYESNETLTSKDVKLHYGIVVPDEILDKSSSNGVS